MTTLDPSRIAASLSALERERLIGWQGPAGAAYNAISEDLHEAGLLNRGRSLTPLGLRVRAILNQD